jgi:hypothetical protein
LASLYIISVSRWNFLFVSETYFFICFKHTCNCSQKHVYFESVWCFHMISLGLPNLEAYTKVWSILLMVGPWYQLLLLLVMMSSVTCLQWPPQGIFPSTDLESAISPNILFGWIREKYHKPVPGLLEFFLSLECHL